jgi:hypothetical protein
MNLSYRGFQYENKVACLPTIESNIAAKYRGATYQIRQSKEISHQSSILLKYRGVAYQSNLLNSAIA